MIRLQIQILSQLVNNHNVNDTYFTACISKSKILTEFALNVMFGQMDGTSSPGCGPFLLTKCSEQTRVWSFRLSRSFLISISRDHQTFRSFLSAGTLCNVTLHPFTSFPLQLEQHRQYRFPMVVICLITTATESETTVALSVKAKMDERSERPSQRTSA